MKTAKLTDNGHPVTKSADGYYYVARYNIATGRRITTPPHWETDLEIERTIYAKPRRDIRPNTIIAVVNSALIGIVLAIAPEYRVLVGGVLAASTLTCMIFVGCSMIRRAVK